MAAAAAPGELPGRAELVAWPRVACFQDAVWSPGRTLPGPFQQAAEWRAASQPVFAAAAAPDEFPEWAGRGARQPVACFQAEEWSPLRAGLAAFQQAAGLRAVRLLVAGSLAGAWSPARALLAAWRPVRALLAVWRLAAGLPAASRALSRAGPVGLYGPAA